MCKCESTNFKENKCAIVKCNKKWICVQVCHCHILSQICSVNLHYYRTWCKRVSMQSFQSTLKVYFNFGLLRFASVTVDMYFLAPFTINQSPLQCAVHRCLAQCGDSFSTILSIFSLGCGRGLRAASDSHNQFGSLFWWCKWCSFACVVYLIPFTNLSRAFAILYIFTVCMDLFIVNFPPFFVVALLLTFRLFIC